MRKILMLALLALACAGASGCISANPCGPSWHPFQRNQNCCCETYSAPVMQAAPCCQ